MSLLRKISILTVLFLVFIAQACFASVPYGTYNYDDVGNPVPSVPGFIPEDVLVPADLGMDTLKVKGLKGPRDMAFDNIGNVFIVDTGNNRIIKLDKDLKFSAEITGFDNNGKWENFNGPEGIFITDDGTIYVCDTQNGRIVKLDDQFKVLSVFGKPDITGIKTKLEYKPQKVAVDAAGRIFVVSQGEGNGLIQLNSDGSFNRFHGANKAKVDFAALFLRNFQTKAQRKQGVKFVPSEYSNLVLDSKGFMYTTTRNVRPDAVKRLNSKGDNIMKHEGRTREQYGDIVWTGIANPQFVDVAVDANNNCYALDAASGKVFVYNIFGDLLFEFGGIRGENKGIMKTPMAIGLKDDKVYLIDESFNLITVYKQTDFAKLVLQANQYYIEGKYDLSLKPWEEVLKYDSNYDLAYVGIGKALMRQEDYKGAMKNFKLAYSRENYSKAFKLYRTQFLRDNFSTIMTSIIVGIILLSLLKRFMRRKGFSLNKLIDSY